MSDAASRIRADLLGLRTRRIAAFGAFAAVSVALALTLAPTPAGIAVLLATFLALSSALGVPLLSARAARALGLASAVILALGLFLDADLALAPSPANAGVRCFFYSLGVGAGFFLGLAALSFRWWRKFGATAFAAGAASTGLMLVVLHAHCPLRDAPHLFLAHLPVLLPIAGAAMLLHARRK